MVWKAHLEGQNFIFFSTFGGWVGGSDPNVENSTFIFFIFFEYFPYEHVFIIATMFSKNESFIIPIIQRRYCWNANTLWKWFEVTITFLIHYLHYMSLSNSVDPMLSFKRMPHLFFLQSQNFLGDFLQLFRG